MTEEQLWKCTPRKLYALLDVHIRVNDPERQKQEKEPERLTVQELLSWR